MLTWGEIRVGYYVALVLLAWLFNGTPSAIFLAILLGLFFERDFKKWLFVRFEVAPDDRASAQAIAAVKAEAQKRGRANDDADKPAPKKAAKPRTAKPKPKTAAGD
jgi:hypothetical protein